MSVVRTRIDALQSEGIVRLLYSTQPSPPSGTRYYVLESKNEHGDTREHKVPDREIGKVLSEIELEARQHNHRFS